MSVGDILILGGLALWAAMALRRQKGRKRNGCCGACAGGYQCDSCEKMQKNKKSL